MPSLSDLNNNGFPTNPSHQSATVTPEVAAAALYAAGFRGNDWIKMLSHTWGESGFDTNNIGDTTLLPHDGPSLGLWQINITAHWARAMQYNAQFGKGWWNVPYYNAQFARELWTSQGEGAWAGSQAAANQHYNDAKMVVVALENNPDHLNQLVDQVKANKTTVTTGGPDSTTTQIMSPTDIIQAGIDAVYKQFFQADPGKVSVVGRFAYFVAGSISITLAFIIWAKNSPAVRSAVNVGITAASKGKVVNPLPPAKGGSTASERVSRQIVSASKAKPKPKAKPTATSEGAKSVARTSKVIREASK